MHPSKFFEMINCKIGSDVIQQFDNNLKEELKTIHPENIIVPQSIELPVYRVYIEYDIQNNSYCNHRFSTKYIILPSQDNDSLVEFFDFWIEMACNDYNVKHNSRMKNINIISEEHICNAVLSIE